MGLFVGEIRLFLTEFLPLFTLEKQFLVYYSFTIYDMSMKLYSYVYHQRLHIVPKRTITQVIPVQDLFALDRSENVFDL